MKELIQKEMHAVNGGFTSLLISFIAGKNNLDYEITKANGRMVESYVGAVSAAMASFPFGLILSPITLPLGYGIGYLLGHVEAMLGYNIGLLWQEAP